MNKYLIMAGLILCLVQPGLAQVIANRDSLALEQLFDSFFRAYVAQNPETATQLGLSRGMGYEYDRSSLDDISPAGDQANIGLLKQHLNRLNKIDRKALTPAQRLDARIFEWCLRSTLDGYKFIDQGYLVNQMTGPHFQPVNFLTGYHTIETRQDAEDYLARMEKIPLKLQQAGQRVESQDKKGIRSPVFIADMVIGTINELVSPGAEKNILYLDFAGKIKNIPGIGSSEQESLRQRAERIISEKIYPAYRKYLEQVKAVRAKSTDAAGVWNLPQGEQYYAHCLKQNTTLSLSPLEVHKMGLAEVEALQKKGRALLESLGIKEGDNYGDLVRQYWAYLDRSEIKNQIAYNASGPWKNQVIRDYQSFIDSALVKMPEAFDYLPRTKVQAQPVPEFKEQGGVTYYEPASLDGKRPGVFFVNMMNMPNKAMMRSLTYHETVPGHHYQLAVQQELGGNRMYRNLFFLTGFGEGWAMYVQELAYELGWLPDIYSRIAEVNSQLFRAVRVVLDTGIHLKQWNRGQAMAYMEQNLGWASGTEVDRYIVWPGQACSYTLGRMHIKQLREKAKEKMGPRFDLKKFHHLVLENGSMPLDILGKKVDDYIKGGI
ncbi:DUF885 domain-containing protein [candidate division TA06 bacterium]|nr:DUF885 domain-containing protein [candidate division TA06 bacterium]